MRGVIGNSQPSLRPLSVSSLILDTNRPSQTFITSTRRQRLGARLAGAGNESRASERTIQLPNTLRSETKDAEGKHNRHLATSAPPSPFGNRSTLAFRFGPPLLGTSLLTSYFLVSYDIRSGIRAAFIISIIYN